MIRIEDVSLHTAEGKFILRDISWHIQRGENWVLFGRNGAGKTRLLEIITGYQFPSRGVVYRFGDSSAGNDIRELRKRIGYVGTPLREKFSPHEKIIDVVLSGIFASVGLYEEAEYSDRGYARDLLGLVGMDLRVNEPFGVLSDGEKQKIIMLRAIINEPELLILDEPSKGLDIGAREDLLEAIKKIDALGNSSILYVTHHIEEILPLFTRTYILKNGEQFFCGNTGEGITGESLTMLFERPIAVERIHDRYYPLLNP
ncbi:MAG: molybdenum ABC transporter ATP-binding protein [Spirochaetae bacterium HGW-Spirochaetae-1]|jgi:iron complex transport system ATP-binding protein|nr:MAG: molybdenum ABC transporter ATP-binding protein [Spirochaetae bacterium HGW-Spirochaetae-1]